MIKGLFAVLIVALIIAAIMMGIFHLLGITELLSGILAIDIPFLIIIFFAIISSGSFIIFFAMIYYMAEKKPEVSPSEYKLEEEKGKNE